MANAKPLFVTIPASLLLLQIPHKDLPSPPERNSTAVEKELPMEGDDSDTLQRVVPPHVPLPEKKVSAAALVSDTNICIFLFHLHMVFNHEFTNEPPSLATVTKIVDTGKPDERKEPISAPQVFFFLLMDRAPEIGCMCVCWRVRRRGVLRSKP